MRTAFLQALFEMKLALARLLVHFGVRSESGEEVKLTRQLLWKSLMTGCVWCRGAMNQSGSFEEERFDRRMNG